MAAYGCLDITFKVAIIKPTMKMADTYIGITLHIKVFNGHICITLELVTYT